MLGPNPRDIVRASPAIPCTVPNDSLLNIDANSIVPNTNITVVTEVQIKANENDMIPNGDINKNAVVTIHARIIDIATRFVLVLSMRKPQKGTQTPPNKFPTVSANAAVI
tara:strand:+ start:278 stop:607 length:330 start_codon:yes stop_codon:yes gene_type:complete